MFEYEKESIKFSLHMFVGDGDFTNTEIDLSEAFKIFDPLHLGALDEKKK